MSFVKRITLMILYSYLEHFSNRSEPKHLIKQ